MGKFCGRYAHICGTFHRSVDGQRVVEDNRSKNDSLRTDVATDGVTGGGGAPHG